MAVSAEPNEVGLRLAAIAALRGLVARHGLLTAGQLAAGFEFSGRRVRFDSPFRGIWIPPGCRQVLSIKTVLPRSSDRIRYQDQRRPLAAIFDADDTIAYSMQGEDPQARDNLALQAAWREGLPLIYFVAVHPGRYDALCPVFVQDWNPAALEVRVAVGAEVGAAGPGWIENSRGPDAGESRYQLRQVKQRLHQAAFRLRVLAAYGDRCAISGLPEPMLLDAAHIDPDVDERLGQPVVSNGLALSKVHHAAFDAHLIGIDPDGRVHVAEQLLAKKDGPLLEGLKALRGVSLRRPRLADDGPDPERLARRFEAFRRAG